MDKLIEIENLHFAYYGQPSVLKGINLTIHAGDRLALTGANGAGKSTLFHLIVGLKKPEQGRLCVFGRDRITEADFLDVRQKIGLVFQDPDDQLFCPTVFEDLAFGLFNLGKTPCETKEIVDQTLHDLKLAHLRDRTTHTLSGGEKRLVSLASVLVMNPDVLLLDEPTNALDEETRDRLSDILQELPQSIILISHDSHFRRKICPKALRIQDGIIFNDFVKCKHGGA